MGIVQHRQIKERIVADFLPHIDLSDVPAAQVEDVGQSRGVACLAISSLTGLDPASAAKTLVDGFHDNGIDAIHYDAAEKALYLIQSKWNSAHAGSVDNGSTLKFLQGVKDLLSSRYEKFNSNINARRAEIDKAINSAGKVSVVIAYSGSGNFSAENRQSIDDFISEVDETKELVNSVVLNQAQLHTYVLSGAQGSTISETVQLFYWGYMDSPVWSYYGQIAASDLVAIHARHGHKLFAKNIRMFLGSESNVNRSIADTLSQKPELFWYYNNGITALADKVTRKAVGGASRDSGQFDCEGLTVVNGAQTIGSLSAVAVDLAEELKHAMVPIRIVSLEGAPDGMAVDITRNNNTQNRIDARNFVALDPEQERLKSEFLLDAIDYEYRQGEIEHSSTNRLGLSEASIALACLDEEVRLSTLAKREVGLLWEDTSRPPYKKLFNSGTTSDTVWTAVKAFRRIDQAISSKELTSQGKPKNIVVHGKRFLAHVAYWAARKDGALKDLSNKTDADILNIVSNIFEKLVKKIEELYPDTYVGSLFNSLTRCQALRMALLGVEKAY